jgi:hypothetical protein
MGSGKTWLAKQLASAWDIPHIEIDRFASGDDVVRFIVALPPIRMGGRCESMAGS